MKLAKCKWCGATPKFETIEHLVRVRCEKCGAYSWLRNNQEAAAKIWGGDAKGDGYQQFEGDKAQ